MVFSRLTGSPANTNVVSEKSILYQYIMINKAVQKLSFKVSRCPSVDHRRTNSPEPAAAQKGARRVDIKRDFHSLTNPFIDYQWNNPKHGADHEKIISRSRLL